MTKEELNKQIADVIAVLGEPSSPYDEPNEAAKRIKDLRSAFKSEQMKLQHEAKRALEKDLGVSREIVERIPAKPIYIDDHDLKGFSEIEKAIIETHFENRDLNQQQLAKQVGVARQTITGLFHSTRFNILRIKYYEYVMPGKLMLATEKLVDAGHEKTILRANEHFGIMKPEKQDINIVSKPIDDPDALKLLKELGDKLSEGNK